MFSYQIEFVYAVAMATRTTAASGRYSVRMPSRVRTLTAVKPAREHRPPTTTVHRTAPLQKARGRATSERVLCCARTRTQYLVLLIYFFNNLALICMQTIYVKFLSEKLRIILYLPTTICRR